MGSHTDRELVSGWLDACEHAPQAADEPVRLGGLTVMTTAADRVARLAMDARYDLERRDLYRAKAGGPDAVSPERLHHLEHNYELAAGRLAAAEAEPRAETA